ncbi:hypothetical protein ACLMJK_003854 [Lecanora helva]
MAIEEMMISDHGKNHENGYINKSEALIVIDLRTGTPYRIPIQYNAISATHFAQIKAPENEDSPADQNEHGLRVFDAGFQNTAVSQSAITYVDGKKGTIQYRGYSITDLYGKVRFVDTAFLLIWGHIPSKEERAKLEYDLAHTALPSKQVFDVIRAFPSDAPPLTMITAGLAAIQGSQKTMIPAHMGKNLYLKNPKSVDRIITKLMADLAVVSAIAYCHHEGVPFHEPNPNLSYIENLLHMMGRVDESTGLPNSHHVSCLERLWTLVADHEMTCSTAAFLQTASSLSDPYSCLISAIGAGFGILHGGAIEVAYKNIAEVASTENIPAKIEGIKSGKERLFGYGHRLYKVVDPRSVFIREVVSELGEEIQNDPLLKIAFEIDRVASTDEYFTSRKLHPNADLFASFAYKAMGFKPDFILILSMVSRTQGFLAHWREAMEGSARIWRPMQIYNGELNKRFEGQ